MAIFGACSSWHCSPARAPLLPRCCMRPAVCPPLLLPPRDFARTRLLLPWSGAHSVHARGGLKYGVHSCHEVLHCCPMPAHRPVRKLCSRPVRPQVSDAARLAQRNLADSLLLICGALPIRPKDQDPGRATHMVTPDAASGRRGTCPDGSERGPRGAGGGSARGLWARYPGRDRRATPVQLDTLLKKSGPPLSHDIYIY